MCLSNAEWLARKQYEERGQNYRTVWDLYLKFYTVFLTMNIVGIGLVVQHVKGPPQRWWIVLAFIVQNFLSAGTAFCIARFSKDASLEVEALSELLVSQNDELSEAHQKVLQSSPLPASVGMHAGWANLLSHVALIGLWIAVGFAAPAD